MKPQKNAKSEITQIFLEVQKEFPFGKEYLDGSLDKYIAIALLIMRELPRGSKILFMGSGACDVEAILSKLGYNMTAIDDLNDQWHLIGKNRERITDFAKRMGIEFIIQSADSLPVKENYFDAVLLIDVLEHLHNSPRELLNYAILHLKPNGLLIIETPNAAALAKRLWVLFGKTNQVNVNFIYWNVGEYRNHFREYTLSELKMVLSYHNLVAIKSKMLNEAPDKYEHANKMIIRMYKFVSDLYANFKSTILISGKKPNNWHPTDISIKRFKKYYRHIEKYNVDREPDELIINKIIRSEKMP